jgi:solute carrier family 29 (equilibrative nucleoside transporter), member 1/2/3
MCSTSSTPGLDWEDGSAWAGMIGRFFFLFFFRCRTRLCSRTREFSLALDERGGEGPAQGGTQNSSLYKIRTTMPSLDGVGALPPLKAEAAAAAARPKTVCLLAAAQIRPRLTRLSLSQPTLSFPFHPLFRAHKFTQDALMYAVHFMSGIAMLTPWNALISAADYFEARLPGKAIARSLTAAYLVPTLVGMLVLLGRHERTHPRGRVLIGLPSFFILMLALAITEAVQAGGTSLGGLLTVAALVGCVDGFTQPGLFGEAALLPPAYTQALVAGTAVSGVAISLLRIITKASLPETGPGQTAATTVFFAVAGALCAAAAVAYGVALPRARAARLLAAGHVEARGEGGGGESGGGAPAALTAPHHSLLDLPPPDPAALAASAAAHHPPPSRRRVAAAAWPLVAALAAIYIVTLSIFPGVLVDAGRRLSSPSATSWFVVSTVAGFNAADLAGKLLPAIPAVAARLPGRMALLAASAARALFIPAFFGARRLASPTAAAATAAALTVALGLTNGLVTVASQMRILSGLHGRDAEDAGTAGVLALVVGLCVGSALSFAWT